MKPFSRWRWAFQCCFGLRHRKGESCHLSMKGAALRRTSRCTRCGIKSKGMAL